MDVLKPLIDINQASLDELCQVLGIGTTMAKRIISARPYEKLDDLLQVRGISDNLLAKWLPLLTVHNDSESIESVVESTTPEAVVEGAPVSTPLIDQPPEKESPALIEETTSMDNSVQKTETETPAAPPIVVAQEKQQKVTDGIPQRLRQKWDQSTPLTQAEALVFGTAAAAVVFISAIIFTLGLLAGINGGLSYVSSSRYTELQSQMTVINQQVKQLQLDTGSLQDRMNSLEGLSGRVSAVEKNNADLKSQIEANAKNIQTLTTQTKQLEGEITTLQERSQAYEKFFEGLKTLVETVLPKTTP